MPAYGTDAIPAVSRAEEIASICRARLSALDYEIAQETQQSRHLQQIMQDGSGDVWGAIEAAVDPLKP